jgi:hypothetical protein
VKVTLEFTFNGTARAQARNTGSVLGCLPAAATVAGVSFRDRRRLFRHFPPDDCGSFVGFHQFR